MRGGTEKFVERGKIIRVLAMAEYVGAPAAAAPPPAGAARPPLRRELAPPAARRPYGRRFSARTLVSAPRSTRCGR